MKRPSICASSCLVRRARPRRGTAWHRRRGRFASVRRRYSRIPRAANLSAIAVLLERASDASHPELHAPSHRRRDVVAFDDDVGDGEPAARFQHAKRFRDHAVLVGREVDHAVRDDDVDGVVGQRDVLDLALSGTRRSSARTSPDSRARAPASRRSCRGRRPCRWGRHASPKAGRRCRRRSRDRARLRRACSSASAVGLPQPSDASIASAGIAAAWASS